MALELGIRPLKLNCVLINGTNEDEYAEPAAPAAPAAPPHPPHRRTPRRRTPPTRLGTLPLRRLHAFAALSIDRPIDVRFIEYMPFDRNGWSDQSMVPFSEMLTRLRQEHPELSPLPTPPNDVAVSWKIPEAVRAALWPA